MNETPPPFEPGGNYAPRNKNSANPIIWILVAIGAACCICIIAGAFMMKGVVSEGMSIAKCPIGMELYQQSITAYVKEKGVFPPAQNWQDEIAPYFEIEFKDFQEKTDEAKSMGEMFDIPKADEVLVCYETRGQAITGIYYNTDLAGKKPTDFPDVDKEILLFESDGAVRNGNVPFNDRKTDAKVTVFGQDRKHYKMTYGGDLDSGGSSVKVGVD